MHHTVQVTEPFKDGEAGTVAVVLAIYHCEANERDHLVSTCWTTR